MIIKPDVQLHKRYGILKTLSFLLGLACSTNIVYIFKVGNSNIDIGTVASLVIVFLFAILDIPFSITIPKSVKRYIVVFCLFVLFSMFPALIYFHNSSYLIRYLYGVIMLAMVAVVAISVMMVFDCQKVLLYGWGLGLLINIVVCIIAYIQFVPGVTSPIYRELYNLFPQDSLQNGLWSFRVQGLFKESSHFIGYLIVSMFVFVPEIKNTFLRYITIFTIIILTAYSGSGNIVVLFISCLVSIILKNGGKIYLKHNSKVSLRKSILVAMCLTIIIIIWLVTGNNFESVMSAVKNSLDGATISDNQARYDNIVKSIMMIPSVPVGVGYNMLISYNNLYGNVATSAYSTGASSFIIQLILEVGLFGAIAYAMCIYSTMKYLVRLESQTISRTRSAYLAVAVFSILVLQSTNGVSIIPYYSVTIGITLSALHESLYPNSEKLLRKNALSTHYINKEGFWE